MTADRDGARVPVPEALLERAVARLRAGQLVAFPTETVYGLGADASQPAAVARIFALKGRPSTHPVIVHLPEASQIGQWAAEVPLPARRLAERCWPGPLTLILRKAAHIDPGITGGQDSIGLRVPAHPVAQQLLRAFGGGIAAPSANRYGHVSPTTADHVRDEFGADDLLILDGGPCEVGIESTIVDARSAVLRILRPGMLGKAQIESAVADLPGVQVIDGANADAPRVPGSTAAHYAPRIPLQLCDRTRLGALAVDATQDSPIAVLALTGPPPSLAALLRSGALHWTTMALDPARYAHDLYAHLHALEQGPCLRILVEAPPGGAAWQAVKDRLQRAAHDTVP